MKMLEDHKKRKKNRKLTSIRQFLHATLPKLEPARDHANLHASDLLKKGLFEDKEFCPREYALLDTLKLKRPDEFLHTSNQKVFAEGNTAANWLIHKMADAGIAVGHWDCKYCHTRYKFQKRPSECKECCHTDFQYIEVRFRSQESDISGGIDIFVDLGEPKLRIAELKTMMDTDFKKLVAPLAEHKWRTNLYMRLVEDSNSKFRHKINTKEALVFYMCKGGFGYQDDELIEEGIRDSLYSPFKEYRVARDDDTTQTKWNHAKALKRFRDGKGKLPKGICPTSACKRAQSCSVKNQCFSAKFIHK
jgi:hypothetical protein